MRKFFALALGMLICGAFSHDAQAESLPPPSAAEVLDIIRLRSPELIAATTPEEVEIIEKTGEKVVAAMPVTAKAVAFDKLTVPAEKISTYVHLSRREGKWIVSGMRMAYPGFVRYLDFMVREAPKYDEEIKQDRMVMLLGASGLIAVETDQTLIAHFRKNRDTFEAIRQSFAARSAELPTRIERDGSELSRLLGRAGIAYADHSVLSDDESISLDGENGNGCDGGGCFTLALTFVPPQFKVGYFHVDQSERVPHMTIREYFVIRALGDGWYFFRQN